MSLFIQLPVSAPSTIGTVAESDIEMFLPFDPSSYEFWNFRKASLKAANDTSKALIPQGKYSFSDNALNATVGGSDNLNTSLSDNGEFSFCGVISNIGSSTAAMIIAGNYTATPLAGLSIYRTTGGALSIRAGSRVLTIGTANATAPLFFGVSVSKSAPAVRAVVKQLGTIDYSAAGASFPDPYVQSTQPVVIGSFAGGAAQTLKFYEFATYSRSLSLEELNTRYLQAKLRMKGVGVNI